VVDLSEVALSNGDIDLTTIADQTYKLTTSTTPRQAK
jgi:hypothetical protein